MTKCSHNKYMSRHLKLESLQSTSVVNMNTMRRARILFQFIAFGFFIFQMQNSIVKYMENPIVQHTSTTSFDKIKKPVLYVCQDGQFIPKEAELFGYEFRTDLIFGLLGYSNMLNITWKGRHENLTFEDLAKRIYIANYTKFGYTNDMKKTYIKDLQPEFFATTGFCFKVLPINNEIKLRVTEKSTAFITDPAMTTFLKLNRMKHGSFSFGPTDNGFFESIVYEIQISLKDTSISDGAKCTNYGNVGVSYGTCIETAMEEGLIDWYGCLPPWFKDTKNLTCEINKNVKTLEIDNIGDYRYEFLLFNKGMDMDFFKFCLPPCLTMHINYKKINHETNIKSWANVQFKFLDEVTVYTSTNAYDMFSLVVDLGSSLGLWLGLSALSMYDYILEAFVKIKYFKF